MEQLNVVNSRVCEVEKSGKRLVFSTLFSGSSGNSVYIKYGNDEILIDCGKSCKAICEKLKELGTSIDNIKAIFITHEHSDHLSAMKVLLKKKDIPIYIHKDCCFELGELTYCLVPFYGEPEQRVGDITVTGFYTPHDSMQSLGYIVKCGDTYLGVATDMGMVAKNVVQALAGCRAVLIEANYDPMMLKNGPYPPYLKKRVSSNRGHLSNDDSALLASVLVNSGTKVIALGHLSLENNMPELALKRVCGELESRGLEAKCMVASRNDTTVIFDEIV